MKIIHSRKLYCVCVKCDHVCCEENFPLRSSLCKSIYLPLLVPGRSQTHLVLKQNSWHQYLYCCCIYQNIVPWSPAIFPFMHAALFWWSFPYSGTLGLFSTLSHIMLLLCFCALHPIYVYTLVTGMWIRIWVTYLETLDKNLVFCDMYCS